MSSIPSCSRAPAPTEEPRATAPAIEQAAVDEPPRRLTGAEATEKFAEAKRLRDSDPERCRALILALLNDHPGDGACLDLLSQAYAIEMRSAQSVAEQAEICLRQVRQFAELKGRWPEWRELLYRLSSQRVVLQRLAPEMMDELDMAAEELRTVIELARTDGDAADEASGYFQLGRTIKHEGDTLRTTGAAAEGARCYDEAIGYFEKAMALAPERIDALGEIVLILLARGEAAAALEAVDSHAPLVREQLLRGKMTEMRASLLGQLGRGDEAARAFEEAIALNPDLMNSYLHLAVLHQSAGRLAEAEEVLRRSVDHEPHFLEGHLYVGHLATAAARYEDARRSFENLLATPKADAVFVGMLPSHALYRTGLYYQAAGLLADTRLRLGDTDGALEAAERATQHRPADAALFETMGRIHSARADAAAAERCFTQAAEQGGLPDAHFYLAELLFERDDLESAMRHVTRALESNKPSTTRAQAEALRADLLALRDAEP